MYDLTHHIFLNFASAISFEMAGKGDRKKRKRGTGGKCRTRGRYAKSKNSRPWPPSKKPVTRQQTPSKKRGREKFVRRATPQAHNGTDRETFRAIVPHVNGKVVPTFMRKYLIALVQVEGLKLSRVFRGLSTHTYYNWCNLVEEKDSPSPVKKHKRGRPRIHNEDEVRAIGEDMSDGKYSSLREAAAELGTSKNTISRIIGVRQLELDLKPVTRKTNAEDEGC